MCSIYAHKKEHQSSCDDGSSGGVCPLPSNSTTEVLYLLGATIDFIGYWLKSLENNFIERCNMYVFNMNNCFRKSQLNFLKTHSKEKRKLLLHAIGGGWYANKLGQNLPPLKRRRSSKKVQKQEDEI